MTDLSANVRAMSDTDLADTLATAQASIRAATQRQDRELLGTLSGIALALIEEHDRREQARTDNRTIN